jgi:hypothetical protein
MPRRLLLSLPILALPSLAQASASLEMSALAYPWGPGTALAAGISKDHLYASLEARGAWGGSWFSRTTGGVDAFSSDKLDLFAGAFVGGAASWPEGMSWGSALVGYELGLGLGAGPVKARYRHIHGLRPASQAMSWGCETCPTGPWYEEQFRLSAEVLPKLGVFGEVLLQDPCRYDSESYRAYGLGATVAF